MQQERFDELQKDLAERPDVARLAEAAPPPPMVQLSEDLTVIRIFINEAISQIEKGGKSRPRSLAITKLQEAFFWLGEDLRLS